MQLLDKRPRDSDLELSEARMCRGWREREREEGDEGAE